MRWFLAIFALLFLGCGGSGAVLEQVRGPRPLVQNVRLSGVKRFSKEQLLGYLHTSENSWLPFTRASQYDEAVAAVDSQRIEELYRAFGYRQARVVSVRSVLHDKGPTEVDLVVHVEEGLPTRVSQLEALFAPSTLTTREELEVRAAASLHVGDPFEVERLNATIGDLRIALMRLGFPLANVSASARVHEGARRAEVELRVVPGQRATVRNVAFEGLYRVPKEKLDVEVRFAKGELYSPALTRQIEESLVALRVFRWVAVVPPTEVHDGWVDLTVRVSEADPRTVTLGPELSIETVRWQEQAVARYTDVNLFGELTRLDVDAAAGYAEIPNFWSAERHGVVASVAPTFTKKGLVEDFVVWSLAPSIAVDVRDGYDYWVVGERFGPSRWFGSKLNISLTHNIARYDYFEKSPTLDPKTTALGRDFRDPYLLSYLEAKASAYFVDSIPSPTEGVIFDGLYDYAGGLVAGNYDFHKALLGARGYHKLLEPLQLVARFQGGAIFPYGSAGAAPLSMKYYLGGANAVRGFGSRRLSPALRECSGTDCSNIPIGGYSMVQGTLELRWHLAGPFTLAGFAELGDVKAGSFEYDFSTWNYTAGPGLRIKTPLGLVRGDVGFRLNRLDAYPGEKSYAFYVGLGEAL